MVPITLGQEVHLVPAALDQQNQAPTMRVTQGMTLVLEWGLKHLPK